MSKKNKDEIVVPDPRAGMMAKYKNHKWNFLVSKYVATKFTNSIKKTTKQLFASVKEFMPQSLEFMKELDKEFKAWEKDYEKYNKVHKRTPRFD